MPRISRVSAAVRTSPSRTLPIRPAAQGAERRLDICILALGLVLGTCGAFMMIDAALQAHREVRFVIGVGVYSVCLLTMLVCSLLYRSATEPVLRQRLRRLDHAAIFAMIAGSATPFALARTGEGCVALTAALWAVAVAGMAFKLRLPIGGLPRSTILYVLLGWAALVSVGPVVSPKAAFLIAAGGICYSAGVPFLLWRGLPYRLATWHVFVLAGAACHYLAILDGVVLV
jgi:hemolysin III